MISIDKLQSRAKYLRLTRDFFYAKNIIEVDCPILSKGAAIDMHIDLFETTCLGENYYLHSSPEYGMKRLLAAGSPDIYQISHVFRKGECSPRHNPEFTLLEWYRLGFTINQMIEETIQLISHILGEQKVSFLSYEEAFKKHLNKDLCSITKAELSQALRGDLSEDVLNLPIETLLPLVFSECVESKFDPEVYTVIYDFPANQAALARVKEGHAKRFEIYFKGYELANGYLENQSAKEQKERFEKVLKVKKDLKIDKHFLESMNKLPDCSGVAVGFDRLLMLALDQKEISSIIPIAWEEC